MWLIPAVQWEMSSGGAPMYSAQTVRRVLDAVAEAHGTRRSCVADGPTGDGHGVGVVQQPCLGAEILDVSAYVEQRGDCSEAFDEAAGSDGIPDRLVDAKALRDATVDVVTVSDSDGRDDVVGAAQGSPPVHRGVHRRGDAGVPHHLLDEAANECKTLLIDVHKAEVAAFKRRERQKVSNHASAEDDATGSDYGYMRHNFSWRCRTIVVFHAFIWEARKPSPMTSWTQTTRSSSTSWLISWPMEYSL